jgi:glyoxylase-like metal-dependent hydrolase (beta-lactamase superfamily II)
MSEPFLHVIDLDHALVGYRKFLSCWVCRDERLTFIVDPGPMSSVDHLIESLKALRISKIDYVLVTHIHLDHAGATAEVVRAFPGARVLCHERGVRHMLDPTRLWQGSLDVLGEVAEAYGQPPPVAEEAMVDATEIARAGIRVVPTPGHAAHHLSFIFRDMLFAGEMAGLHAPLPKHMPERTYLRPATPPKFILEVAVESLDRTLALSPPPQRMIFGHYGLVTDPPKYLTAARDQLAHWVATVRELSRDSADGLQERAHKHLLETDPLYANFLHLDEDIQEREYHYVGQTLDGMLDYVRSVEEKSRSKS